MSSVSRFENDLLDTLFVNVGVSAKDAEIALRQMGQAAGATLVTLHTTKDYAEASKKAQRIRGPYGNRFIDGVERIYGKRTTSKGPH